MLYLIILCAVLGLLCLYLFWASYSKSKQGRAFVAEAQSAKDALRRAWDDLAKTQDSLHKTITLYEGQIAELRQQLKAKETDLAHFVHSHNFHIKGREAPHAGPAKLDVQCGCGARHFVTEEMWGRLFGGEKPAETIEG